MDALGVLDHLPVTARLSINVPYELVTIGSDWEAYRLAFAHWIINVAPTLPDGRYDIELPNTALTCIAIKQSDRPARVVISRPIQDDETLSQRVGQQITRKMKKLRRYKADGYATVLILEAQDHSLMNQHKMLEAVRKGLGGSMPEGLDQLWFTEAKGNHVGRYHRDPILVPSDELLSVVAPAPPPAERPPEANPVAPEEPPTPQQQTADDYFALAFVSSPSDTPLW